MKPELPLLDRIYADPLYADLCRFVGYGTKPYRELRDKLELLGEAYGKAKAEAAQSQLVLYEGQYTTNPQPLAEVKLRPDVRRYVFQLLGPSPEQEAWFYTNADGTPCGCTRPHREEPKPEEPRPKPKTPRGDKSTAPKQAGMHAEPKGKPKKSTRKGKG